MKIRFLLFLLCGAAIAHAQSIVPVTASCGVNSADQLVINGTVISSLYVSKLTADSFTTNGPKALDGVAVFSGGSLESSGVPLSNGIISPKPIAVTLTMAKAQTVVEAGGTVFASFAVPPGVTIQKVAAMWQIGTYPDPINREWDLQVYMTSATSGVVYAKNNSFQKYPFPQTQVFVSVN